MNTKDERQSTPELLLAHLFQRNGYLRRQNAKRRQEEGYGQYKKGDEVRLVLKNEEELVRAQKALALLGFKPGRPYSKARQIALPLYGRKAVVRFLELVNRYVAQTGP